MGIMSKYQCGCGYTQELVLGGGMASNREYSVRGIFTGEELAGFDNAQDGGVPDRFGWERELALCPSCRKLAAMPVLRYWTGDDEHTVQKPCEDCGGPLTPQSEPVSCPKCGGQMVQSQTGFWD